MSLDLAVRKRKFDTGSVPVPKKSRPNSPVSEVSDYESDHDTEAKSLASTPLTPYSVSSPSTTKIPRPKPYLCPFDGCDKAFNRPSRLSEHIRSHNGERPFRCPQTPCTKTFLRQSHLNHHIKSAHSAERDYPCTWPGCDKEFATASRLKKHVEGHEGKEKFKCTDYDGCDKTFRKAATLQRHVEVDHLNLKPFRCERLVQSTGELCDAGFDTAAKLRAHEGRCHDETLYLCSFCDDGNDETEQDTSTTQNNLGPDAEPLLAVRGFPSYSALQEHIKLVHPPQCPQCSLICSSLRELQRHVEIRHSGVPLDSRRTFLCTVEGCTSKGFTKQSNLNSHIRTVHGKDRTFVCGETDVSSARGLETWDKSGACHRVFSAKATLEAHIRLKHVRQVSATPAQLTNPSMLSSTLSKLTGSSYDVQSGRDIPCVAPSCSFKFKREHDLISHAQKAHDMSEEEIIEALAEREALTGGKFWVGGDDLALDFVGDIVDEEEEEWRLALGIDGPAFDVRTGTLVCGTVPSLGNEPGEMEEADLGALTSFCASKGSPSRAHLNFIDPALI